jgi:hypothetical protein
VQEESNFVHGPKVEEDEQNILNNIKGISQFDDSDILSPRISLSIAADPIPETESIVSPNAENKLKITRSRIFSNKRVK